MKAVFPGICAAMLMFVNAQAANTPDEQPFIYTTSYEATTWQGHVKAYPIGKSGVSETAQWDAADLIPQWQTRRILTGVDGTAAQAVPFEWQHLNDMQKSILSSADVLQYLRGNDALEIEHGVGQFRDRKGKLGDIVNSSPLYVSVSDSAYQFLPAAEGGSSYRQFVDSKRQRRAMLYVGANDGMLHGFDAISGIEKTAFIPSAIFDHLPLLSDIDYAHRLFVDGQITAGDAYLGNSGSAAWKSILLGSTGAAAKSMFAIDVSDPEAQISTLLWQKSAEDDGQGVPDDDMGYLLGEAFAIRLRNGSWAALYGNGYQSEKQRAVMVLVDLVSGRLRKKMVAGAVDPVASNGLGTPALVFSQQRDAITAYAGDLLGSLWKFDLSASEPERWQVAFDGRPLFEAADSGGKMQSLVQQALLEHHPQGGAMIMFGAGRTDDDARSKPQTASLYGILEKTGAAPAASRSQLQKQILTETDGDAGKWQLTSNIINWGTQRGWYIDLPAKVGQVIGKLQIIDGVLWALTYSSSAEKSYLIAIDFATGGATAEAALADFPQDVSMLEVDVSAVTPVFITLPDGRRQLVIRGLDGGLQTLDLNPATRRPIRAWRQLPVPSSSVDPSQG
ncbi:pilus assembly protein [Collimonas sp. OK607]|uniref:pilus assembly protein n=1 Tax=Collimonas sp. OK607 TaxID=1798194 RepID=UPI00147F6D39|nr:PilC/PilY family type IV pilus protein [Collimonas sp. OK607]